MRFNKKTKINLKNGQVMLLTTIFFMVFALGICLGFINPIINQKQVSDFYWASKTNYYLSESGIEDVLYKIKNSVFLSQTESTLISDNQIYTDVVSQEEDNSLLSRFGSGNFLKRIKARIKKDNENNIFEIVDWREDRN